MIAYWLFPVFSLSLSRHSFKYTAKVVKWSNENNCWTSLNNLKFLLNTDNIWLSQLNCIIANTLWIYTWSYWKFRIVNAYHNCLNCIVYWRPKSVTKHREVTPCFDQVYFDKPKVVSRSQKSKADNLVFIKIAMPNHPPTPPPGKVSKKQDRAIHPK